VLESQGKSGQVGYEGIPDVNKLSLMPLTIYVC